VLSLSRNLVFSYPNLDVYYRGTVPDVFVRSYSTFEFVNRTENMYTLDVVIP
jgi:hypothetical protein